MCGFRSRVFIYPVSSLQSDLYGAMGFVVLNSNLPNQTDSYAV